MKNLFAALTLATIVLCSTTLVNAQTYKTDWATQVTLAGSGGTDLAHTLTLKTNGTALVGNPTYTFPTPTAGLFHSDGSGNLTLSAVSLTADVSGILPGTNGGTGVNNGAKTITLGGNMSTFGTFTTGVGNITLNADAGGTSTVTLPPSGTLISSGTAATGTDLTGNFPGPTIATTAGPHIVAALNSSGVAGSLNSDVLNLDATLHVTTHALGLNLATANIWTGKLTVNTGAAKGFQYVDGNQTAGFVLTEDVSGNATWTNPTSGFVTSATGTAPITINGTNTAQTGAITIAVTTSNLTASGVISVTNGTGSLVGSSASAISLSNNATLSTTGSTLGINLGNANIWTADQTLPTDIGQSNSLVASINGAGTSLINIAHGGTNSNATPTAGAVAYGDGSAHQFTLAGTAGQVLQSNGAGTPTWANAGATVTFAPSTTNVMVAGSNNNFAITATQSVYYLQNSTGSNTNLSGIVAAASDRLIILVNNSTGAANSITLTNQDGTSTAANQFHLQGASNITLGVDGTATLIYDSTANAGAGAWRVIANY